MGMLAALEARLAAGEGPDADGDGYYIRAKSGKKLGPMEEFQFNALCGSGDVDEVTSAWRITGGSFYKVSLRRRTIWDSKHAFSFKAFNHLCELLVIIFCFVATVSVFYLLLTSKDKRVQQELKESGDKTLGLLIFLFVITIVTAIMTVHRLLSRWRQKSTEMFASEV